MSERKRRGKLGNRIDVSRCEICMRDSQELSKRKNHVIEVHHVIEVQHGGSDDPGNLRALCTQCHRFVHARRAMTHFYDRQIPIAEERRTSIVTLAEGARILRAAQA